MENQQNKYIEVSYKLYDISEGKQELIETAPAEKPFQFISGFGVALPAFEEKVAALDKDASFEFELSKEDAYGERHEERVVNLERDVFCINGHFDHDNVFEGAFIPLQNEDGNRFMGKVVAINDDFVKMDLNHPLAGMTLRFEGKVLESREATNDEVQHMVNHLSGEDCCCDHDHCNCNHDHAHKDGDCCCGNHNHRHHDGNCGCGHCH